LSHGGTKAVDIASEARFVICRPTKRARVARLRGRVEISSEAALKAAIDLLAWWSRRNKENV
jgi:hypothetical protein